MGKVLVFLNVMALLPYYTWSQDSTITEDQSKDGQYVFYNYYNAVCELSEAYWYRGRAEKEGDRYPFVGYYLSGHQYVYGFYSSLESGGIKNGYFLFYDTLGLIIREGIYENDLRVGEWKYYRSGMPGLWYEEMYEGGIQTGFKSYYSDGNLRRKEIYRQLTVRSKEITSVNCFDSSGKEIECSLVFSKDEFPSGAEQTFFATTDTTSDNSGSKRRRQIEGRVWVRFLMTSEGYPDQIIVVKSTNSKLNRRAATTVEEMPRWKATKTGGTIRTSYYILPITFQED